MVSKEQLQQADGNAALQVIDIGDEYFELKGIQANYAHDPELLKKALADKKSSLIQGDEVD